MERKLLLEVNRSLNNDVWSQMTLNSNYNVHLIFVHDSDLKNEENFDINRKYLIFESIRKFVNIFNESIEVELSAEHFFDFSLTQFLEQHSRNGKVKDLPEIEDLTSKNLLKIDNSIASSLTAEIDRFSTPLISSDALIKIVLFLPSKTKQILFFNEKVFLIIIHGFQKL